MLCCADWLRLISTPKILAIVLDFCWEKTKEFKSSANCVHTSFIRESVISWRSIQVLFAEKCPGMNTVSEAPILLAADRNLVSRLPQFETSIGILFISGLFFRTQILAILEAGPHTALRMPRSGELSGMALVVCFAVFMTFNKTNQLIFVETTWLIYKEEY